MNLREDSVEEIIQLLSGVRGPEGDLKLTKEQADFLLRWLGSVEMILIGYRSIINALRKSYVEGTQP